MRFALSIVAVLSTFFAYCAADVVTVTNEIANPAAVQYRSGVLYILDSGGVYKISPGQPLETVISQAGITSMRLRGNGVLFTARLDGSNAQIDTFDTTAQNAQLTPYCSISNCSPGGISLDSTGNLYVSDSNTDGFYKIDTNLNETFFPQTLHTGATAGGIWADDSGTVYMSLYGNVMMFDSSGNCSALQINVLAPDIAVMQSGDVLLPANQLLSYRPWTGQLQGFPLNVTFNCPMGVCFGSGDHEIYIADTGNGLVRKVVLDFSPPDWSAPTFHDFTVTPIAASATTKDPHAQASFRMEDLGFGVNWGTMQVTIDGNTVEFTVDEERVTTAYPASPWPVGQHQVHVSVQDIVGNTAETDFYFSVLEYGALSLQPIQPAANSFANSAALNFTFSGGPFNLAIDGVFFQRYETASGEINTSMEMEDGHHNVTARDDLGVEAEFSFVLDRLGPTITRISPAQDRTVHVMATFTVVANDSLSGMNWAASKVYLDNTLVYSAQDNIFSWGMSMGGELAIFYPSAAPMTEGPHSILFLLSDVAGNTPDASVSFTARDFGIPIVTVQDLGDVGPKAISNEGTVVGVTYDTMRAFAWSAGTVTELGRPPNSGPPATYESVAYSINSSGAIVGTLDTGSGNYKAALWLPGSYNAPILLPSNDYFNVVATSINDSGVMAGTGQYYDVNTNQLVYVALCWDLSLAFCTQLLSSANPIGVSQINNADKIAGNMSDTNGALPVLINLDGTYEFLDSTAPGNATGINDSDFIVGNNYMESVQFWTYDANLGHYVGDWIDQSYSRAAGVNSSNRIVGFRYAGYYPNEFSLHDAYTWLEGTGVNLNDWLPQGSAWHLNEAAAINDSIWITGSGTNNGLRRAFLTREMEPPATPSGLSAAVATTPAVHLNWTDNSTDEQGFVILRRDSAEGSYLEIALLPAGTTEYADFDVIGGHEYWYYVIATAEQGDSEGSNIARPIWPAAPIQLQAAAEGLHRINLSWTQAVTNYVNGYYIERKVGANGTYARIGTAPGVEATEFHDEDIVYCTQLYYRVQAYSSAQVSEYSTEAEEAICPPHPAIANLRPRDYSPAIGWPAKIEAEAHGSVRIDQATLMVRIGGQPISGTPTWENLTPDGLSARFSFAPATTLPSGEYVAEVEVKDIAGNPALGTTHFSVLRNSKGHEIWDVIRFPDWGTADAINDQGMVVGKTGVNGNNTAVVWRLGNANNLNLQQPFVLNNAAPAARAVDSNGNVGGDIIASNTKGCVWLHNSIVPNNVGYPVVLQEATNPTVSSIFGMNANGAICGYSFTVAPLWRPIVSSAPFTETTYLPLQNSNFNGQALGMNDAGIVVGWTSGPGMLRRATVWTGSAAYPWTIIPNLSEARAINRLNQVVGYLHVGSEKRACVGDLSGAMFTTLPNFSIPNPSNPPKGGEANAINDHGVVVGTSNDLAFMYKDGVLFKLDDLAADGSMTHAVATGINNHNQIVGYSGISPFLMEPHKPSVKPPLYLRARAAAAPAISLHWVDTNGGLARHEIVRSTSINGPFLPIAWIEPGICEYTDSEVSVENQYYYHVRSANLTGFSAYSNLASDGFPFEPVELSVEFGAEGLVTLTWAHDQEYTDVYLIERRAGVSGQFRVVGTVANTGEPENLAYSDAIPNPNFEYFYRVCARRGEYLSPYSNTVSINLVSPTVSAPANLKASRDFASQLKPGAEIILTWEHSRTNCTGYYIERKSAEPATFYRIARVENDIAVPLKHVDTVSSERGEYTYRVQAFNEALVSAFSNEAEFGSPPLIAILSPQNGATSLANLRARIQINEGGAPIKFENITIQLDSNPHVSGKPELTLKPRTLNRNPVDGSWSITVEMPLTDSGNYVLTASATDDNSNTVSAESRFTYARPTPFPSANLAASVVPGEPPRIELRWQTPDNVSSYIVERSSLLGAFEVLTAQPLPPGTTAFVDMDVSENTSYGYRVKAVLGNAESDYSGIAYALILGDTHFSNLSPPPFSWTNLARPTVSANANEPLADQYTIELISDPEEVPVSGLRLAQHGTRLSGTPISDLAEGSYIVSIHGVRTADGANADASWSFGVDLTSPEISNYTNELKTLNRRPGLSFDLKDTLSGLMPATIQLSLDGVGKTTTSQTIGAILRIGFQPAEDLSFGEHTVTIKVSDLAGNKASAESILFIAEADNDPPAYTSATPAKGAYRSSNPYAVLEQRKIVLEFGDELSGVDSQSVVLLSSTDGETYLPVEPNSVSASGLSYTLEDWLDEGAYFWRAEISDLAAPAPNGPAVIETVFVVDSTPPEIQMTLDESNLVSRVFRAWIRDAGCGVAPESVVVTVNEAPVVPHLTAWRNNGLQVEFEFPPGTTGEVAVTISAEDVVTNPVEESRLYTLNIPPPQVIISPEDNAIIHELAATFTVLEGGSEIDRSNISVTLDAVPREITEFAYAPVAGGYVYTVKLPAGNVSHTLEVSVTDEHLQTASADSTFDVVFTPPPVPTPTVESVVDDNTAGNEGKAKDFVYVYGKLLTGEAAIVTELVTAPVQGVQSEVRIDWKEGTWEVIYQKIDPDLNPLSFAFNLRYRDKNGFESTVPHNGTAEFSPYAENDSAIVAPPVPVNPNLPAGAPPVNSRPANALPAASDSWLAVTWDFDPADITGANWDAGTNKSTVDIIGTVRGPGGPYRVRVSGDGLSKTVTSGNGKFRITLDGLEERTYKKITVTANDGRGRYGTSITRQLRVDRKAPDIEWRWLEGFSGPLDKIRLRVAVDANEGDVPNDNVARIARVKAEYESAADHKLPLGSDGISHDFFEDAWLIARALQTGEYRGGAQQDAEASEYFQFLGTQGFPFYHGQILTDGTWPEVNIKAIDGAGNSSMQSAKIELIAPGESGVPTYWFSGHMLLARNANLNLQGNFVKRTFFGITSGLGQTSIARPQFQYEGLNGGSRKAFFHYNNSTTWRHTDENGNAQTITLYDNNCPSAPMRLIAQEVLVDENDNGMTGDESFANQLKHGVIVPVNDSREAACLRLVTFDSELTEPKINTFDDHIHWSDWNGGLYGIQIFASNNIRLYKGRSFGSRIVPQVVGTVESQYSWDFENDADYDKFKELKGQIYVECLPSDEPYRFIEFLSPAGSHGTIRILGISNADSGLRQGKADVALGGPGFVCASTGAFKGCWPLVRSGSRIVPNVNLYYNSLDRSGIAFPYAAFPDPDSAYDEAMQAKFGLNSCGRNFRHSLEMRVIRGDHTIVLVDEDGRQSKFYQAIGSDAGEAPGAEWEPEPGSGEKSTIKLAIQRRCGMERLYYVLVRTGENRQYLFEASSGKLCEIRDPFNNVAALEYDEYGGTRGRLREVRDNQGFVIRFSYADSGDVTVTDTGGNSAHISKSGIKGPLGTYTFHVDDNNALLDYTNAEGGLFVVASEEGVVKRVTRMADRRKMSFAHNFKGQELSMNYYSKAGDMTRTWSQVYDDRGIWTSMMAGDGQNLTQNVSKDYTSQKTTNKYGGTSRTGFDPGTGLPTDHLDPDGHVFKKHHTNSPNPSYQENHDENKPYNYLQNIAQMDRRVDGKGNRWTYDYDVGRLARVMEAPKGEGTPSAVTISAWNEYQQPLAASGPREGYAKFFDYDGVGILKEIVESGEGVAAVTKYKMNVWGRPTQITLSDGRVIYKTYDVAGHEIHSVGPVLVHDLNGHRTGDTVGGQSDNWYDAAGHNIVSRDVDGRKVTRKYNQLGALEEVNVSGGGTTRFREFDALLLPKYTDLPGGVSIEHSYDYHGNESERKYPDVPNYTLVAGSMIPVAPLSRVYTFVHSNLTRTVETTTPRGFKVTKSLLKSGKVRTLTGDHGLAVKYKYDRNGDMESTALSGEGRNKVELDQHGLVIRESIEGAEIETRYERDALGAVRKTTQPGGIILTQGIDALGRATASGIMDTPLTRHNYSLDDPDFLFAPRSVTDLESGAVTQTQLIDVCSRVATTQTAVTTPITYSPAGNFPAILADRDVGNSFTYLRSGAPRTKTDGNGNNITHVYDASVREKAVQDQNSIGAEVERDENGRIVWTKDDRGKIITFEYDDGGAAPTGLLKAKQLPDGKEIRYFYDACANLKYEMHVARPGLPNEQTYTIEYKYDNLDRAIESKDPAGNVTLTTYYDSGRKQSVTDADGRKTTFTYDAAGRPTGTRITPGNLSTSTTYDPNGKVGTIRHADGRTETYTYDERGRVLTLTKTGEGTLTYGYLNGDLVSLTDANGKVTQMRYDNLHRLVETISPDGQHTLRGYDAAGYVTRMTDPKGQQFGFTNFANGRRQSMVLINPNNTQTSLGSFSYDGNTATSDGIVSWSLDEAGRVSAVNGHNVSVTYEYEHPLGLMSRKTYDEMDLIYLYDTAGYLSSFSDGNGNSVTYSRTPGGRLEGALYSSGINATFGYTQQNFVNTLIYTKNNQELAKFVADVDGLGRRRSLTITPANEQFVYGYDTQFRLNSETRTINNATTTTTYTHDAVGNRKERITAAGTETFNLDNGYKLTSVTGVGVATTFGYDLNGNTLFKRRVTEGAVTISYRNLSGEGRTYTFNGQDIVFPPTNWEYQTITFGSVVGSKVSLKSSDLDANPSLTISIDYVHIVTSQNDVMLYSYNASYGGSVFLEEDWEAVSDWALVGFGMTGDWMEWTAGLPDSEEVNYTWDALNRLSAATRKVNNLPVHTASFTYGSMGWHAFAQNVHAHATNTNEPREFAFGFEGELLREETAAGSRGYVNSAVDHALWTYETGVPAGPDRTHFWLTDINGSVFGIANGSGTVLERQRFDAFGKREVMDANEGVILSSTISNRTGWQGRTHVEEVGVQYFRNRFYDSWTGRFLSRDPLGMVDGPSWYTFAHHDPVNGGDPMGLADWTLDNILSTRFWLHEGGRAVIDGVCDGALAVGNAVADVGRGFCDASKNLGNEAINVPYDAYQMGRWCVNGEPVKPRSGLGNIFSADRPEQAAWNGVKAQGNAIYRAATNADGEGFRALAREGTNALLIFEGGKATLESLPKGGFPKSLVNDTVNDYKLPALNGNAAPGSILSEINLPNGGKITFSDPKAAAPSAASRLQANRAAGDAWEAELINNELPKTQSNIQPEITVKSKGPSGMKTRVDAVGQDNATGAIKLTEGKASPTAPLTPNQTVVHPELKIFGGTVVGKGKPPYVGGTDIPPTEVEVIRKP